MLSTRLGHEKLTLVCVVLLQGCVAVILIYLLKQNCMYMTM